MRISTFSTFGRVLLGIRQNQLTGVRAQEQLASGRRLLRPSDDPVGAARALRLNSQLADVGRFRGAITAGRASVDTASSALEQASTLVAEARALLLQGMSGTLAQEDRESIASEFELIRSQLLEIGNLQSGDRFLFSGTETKTRPWVEVSRGGTTVVEYRGNDEAQSLRVGEGIQVPITVPGFELFGRFEPTGTFFDGLTGVSSGLTADQGAGYADLVFRHDSTLAGAIGSVGLALVNGGADDTLLGDNALTVDATAGTIQLGSGPVVTIPPVGEPGRADLVVTNELGGTLHLDLSSYTGADFSGTVTGTGSVSFDGGPFQAVSFTETDLELTDPDRGLVLHVDTTGVRRAGSELVTFGGTLNVFDLMQGISEDLRNDQGLETQGVQARLAQRLEELDKSHEGLLVGLGVLGARGQRLAVSDERTRDVELGLQGLLSDVEDADLAEVALDLARSETLLQLAQASGARLIQTSLLNFLG